MAKISKRFKSALEAFPESLSVSEAVDFFYNDYIGKLSSKNTDESIDLSVNLTKQFNPSRDSVNGSIVPPNGLGKDRKVVALVPEDMEQDALNAGAVMANLDELLAKISGGFVDFNACVAHPSVMSKIAKVARVLGPRGLMPTAKNGMVNADIKTSIKNAVNGVCVYKANKCGCINFKIASVKMDKEKVLENINVALSELSGNQFFAYASISTTFSPGIRLIK